jgi:hypothetical protein
MRACPKLREIDIVPDYQVGWDVRSTEIEPSLRPSRSRRRGPPTLRHLRDAPMSSLLAPTNEALPSPCTALSRSASIPLASGGGVALPRNTISETSAFAGLLLRRRAVVAVLRQNVVCTFCTRQRSFGYCPFWGDKRWNLFSHLFWIPLPVYEFLYNVEFSSPLIFLFDAIIMVNKMDFPPLHESAAPISSTVSQAFPPPQLSIASCLTA